ncbi:sensor histidine kinase [Deinococcus aquatilis]|uniref:sensor histidine kinase n=1 Tax=Deinococcus aquatilis TaxID=519440 RepID=UPI00036E5948|nr:ATP-binding protein [Deinococcus aquatilis]
MKLFARLLVHHLVVVSVMGVVSILAAELAAHPFIRHHVEQMATLIGPQGGSLRSDLAAGMRGTLTRALMVALPMALVVATLTAWFAARRVTASVRVLQAGSSAIASGEYARRLPTAGQDELADLARSFNLMAATLQRVEESRVELIGNVGHELRTPVAAARAYAEAAEDGILPTLQAVTSIRRELAVMERLVEDLTVVSRVEAGRVELHLRAVAVDEVLRQAQERYELPFESRQVTLQVMYPASPLLVWIDPERGQQILANLLSNALRHTPPGHSVQLRVTVQGGHAMFLVQDAGTGIAPEHLERVFERFFRADSARRRGEGSGVGLTIARGLARAMHGDVRVVSSTPQGSTLCWMTPLTTPARATGSM